MSDALSIFTNLGYRAGQADTLDALGKVYQSQGKYEDAIKKYQEVLDIRREIKDRAGEATSQNNLGDAYHSLGDYNKAEQAHTKAYEIFADPEVGAIAGLANARNSLGVVYCSLKNYSEAISLIQKALERRRNSGDRAGEGDCLCNLGNIYCISTDHQDYQQAEKFYEEALSILQEIEHCEFLAKALNGLGDVCLAKKQYENAASNYKQSWQMFHDIGNPEKAQQSLRSQANSYYKLGKDLRWSKKYQEAIDAYEKAQNIFVEIGDSDRAQQSENQKAYVRRDEQLNQFVSSLIFVALRGVLHWELLLLH
ncbi:MAG: tetratricopeptide repeat protein [Microcoleus sp. SU_5_3]|nr:tetratricopeptide repeat protein [Microcoleus sp. SU_5_3]